MKNSIDLFVLGLLLIILGIVISEKEVFDFSIIDYFKDEKIVLGEKNEYYRDYDFSYVQNTDDFTADCKQDLLNIYYTAINAGKDKFTFKCSKDYDNCMYDLTNISEDNKDLSFINNFVHPYNSFNYISTKPLGSNKFTFYVYKRYSEDDIIEINNKITEIEKQIYVGNLNLEQKIKKVHNYIIDNSVYDINRKNKISTFYKSDTAYGTLIQGYGICSGYTDAMQLFLDRLGVINYQVSTNSKDLSNNHIWNGVFLNNSWKHIDLTWDDPVSNDGKNYILFDYLLIDTNTLLKLDSNKHIFDIDVYRELK